ncbi:hypothetical protein QYF36_017486 [Acer negundo]|nr:hypothetical protein QYF36_017486 [Acer negundo]
MKFNNSRDESMNQIHSQLCCALVVSKGSSRAWVEQRQQPRMGCARAAACLAVRTSHMAAESEPLHVDDDCAPKGKADCSRR